MLPTSIRLARPLLVVAALLTGVGVIAVAADDGRGADRGQLTADAPDRSSTTSSSTTTTTVAPTTTVVDAATTATPTVAGPTTTAKPRSTTTTVATTMPTMPPTTVGTVPSTGYPAGAARVPLVNETDVPLDLAVNQAWLRLGPGQSDEGFIIAELGATNRPAGEDIVVAAIPTNYGLRDEGCGDHQLGQLLSPGKSYKIRFYNSGTCQLLGGGPKPTIAITLR